MFYFMLLDSVVKAGAYISEGKQRGAFVNVSGCCRFGNFAVWLV